MFVETLKKMVKVGIAEDHRLVVEGLKLLLNEFDDLEVCLTALNGKSLLYELQYNKPDVILMDINMPELNGIEATKIVKKDYPKIKVLILSMHDDLLLIKELLKIGADGFVLKDTGIYEIKKAIDLIIKDETYFCKPISDKILKELTTTKNTIKKSNSVFPVNITKRELEILKLICMEYTSSQIAGELFISINTVETHRKNLLTKLNCKNSVGLVKWAIKQSII